MSAKIDAIHIVFENCEVIEVPYSDVRYLHLDGIREEIWDNNIRFEDNFDCRLRKRADFMRLILKDKPEYDRIKHHDDITHIDFMSGEKSVYYIGIEWAEGSLEYSNNVGQQVLVNNRGEIEVYVAQADDESR